MTGPVPRATRIVQGTGADSVTLDYAGRFLRRKRLVSDGGRAFVVDLPHTVSLDDGDAFALENDTLIAVRCAEEALLRISGDLARAAWHIGNRHAPCQMTSDHLLIQRDPIIEDMLTRLGLTVAHVTAPFRPERGAYGHGRTHGHDHSHAHSHDHTHG
ncbi:Urease accessory protein UreE 1 [Rhodobacteraceae bacterium THAF1]|uniref:urease accessory protein UreE n=1 Tax=Palleronia sp. THAF1 TaxID=2587842 RepID=UPI000F4150F1|nr:urease accessory protein UreE [Palleronia sp. THAF1]QFU08045.1 Urease accessory protein UreE 1 [Palleronia sp. THAF1]VDC27899.1 Urease accessory protein UreE 1 [Rhodobacteraceae bacterium THAF1]